MGFDLGKRPTFGTAANISGVRTKTLTFSQRRDSLTIFARDETYGYGRKAGAWTGPNKDMVARTRKILRAARLPDAEIRRIKVISERGTVAERLKSGEVRVERPELLRKLAALLGHQVPARQETGRSDEPEPQAELSVEGRGEVVTSERHLEQHEEKSDGTPCKVHDTPSDAA